MNKTIDISEYQGILSAIRPADNIDGHGFERWAAKLTYADYIALERAIERFDISVISTYVCKITDVEKERVQELDMFRFYAIVKHLVALIGNMEERFYKASKPAPMSGIEAGCGFEELNKEFRHEQRLTAAARQRLCSIDEIMLKPLAEVLRWYAFAKAEQDAAVRYQEKLNKLKNGAKRKN